MLQSTIIGAEIQRQNVLKFEIFPLSSFGETVVQSRSSQTKIRQMSVSSDMASQT